MTQRTADPRIVPLLVERWSPRSFDRTAVPPEDIAVMLGAAALAPSAFNYQPWTFLYALRGDPHWELFASLLIPFNREWADRAGALIFIVSDMKMRRPDKESPNHSHSFDAGAAWACLALQATAMGYHAHGMTGIEFDRAAAELHIPDDYRLEAAVAVGRKASPDLLPEGLRAREVPSDRKPVQAISRRGLFH